MKKRLLSALLALALVFVLLPTTALAGETTGKDYDISINGKGWKFEKDTPVYFYGYDPSNYFFSTTADHQWTTNSNLMLTKEGNTVTITIRPSKYHPYESPQFTLKKESTSTEKNDVPCIEMGNGNNLVITGKGTLNITRNESKSRGAALYSDVGDITINGGITVNVSFLNGKDYNNKNVSSNAIYVGDNHNLTVSGSGTNVTATNQGFDSSPATGCVEGGTISVSGGASLSATNTYDDNRSGSDDVKIQHFNSYAISGTKSNPCTLIVADEKSSVTATTNDFTNIAESWAFKYTTIQAAGATIKAGSSASNSTVTTIDNISGQRYAKISVPALQKTSDVLIAKENAVVGVETSIPSANGSGTYFYDQASKTLTLNNVTITSGTNAIQFAAAGTYTVKLEGTNKISNVSNGISVTDDKYITSLNVTITGTGSLDISAKGLAINMKKGDLKFENTGAIKLATSSIGLNNNALSVKGNITITDMSKYSVTGTQQTGGKPLGSEVSLTEASQLKGGTTGYRIITITPAAAKPSTIRYNGTTLKQGEIIKDENGGTATVATKGNTITLNNFKGTKALSFEATLADSTLVLEGTNTLSSIVTMQKGLTISGSGSLTVGSIRVTNNDNIRADLTITGGAHVTVNRPSEDKPAVEVSGNLTVTGEGTQLSAECTAATNPAIEVGGNVTISGDPGTNAYTVKAYNKYAIQRGRDDKLRPSQMPSAFEISGNLSISGSAQVMAQTDSDGAAVWMPKQKVISVVDASLIAQNRSHNFSTISFGDESNMGNIYAKGQEVNIVAENMLGSNSRLAHRAIKAFIYNHYNTGGSNPYYIKVVSEGVQSGGNVNVIPGDCTSTGGYKVTITRGDAYTTPQVAANYTIAGQTMHVGQYYKTDANGNITDGTAQDYNIYCDSENDFTLNNATISSTGTDVAINTNIRYETNVQHHIKLIGTNRINNTFKHAISAGSNSSTIIIEGVGNASDASLTINGNFLPIYSDGKVIINAEVVIVNTTDDNSFKGLISTSDGKGAFDLGSGYKCYASTSTTGTPLEEFYSANYGTYKYLRVTTQTLETGGGSTHQHTWDTSKWYSVGDDYHARKCTGCDEYDLTNKQAHYAWPDEDKGPEGHTEKCMLCDYKYDQSVIKPHEWTGWWVSDYQPEVHAQRCNCGYQGSTHRTLKYVAINSEQHQKQCPVDGCGYKIEYKTSHVYEEGSNICTECGYDKSAPCNHTGDRVYTNNGDGTHKVTCKACGATIVEKETHEFDPTGACVCGATQSGGNPTPDNPGTIVIIRPAEEEKPAQQPNPSTGANDLVGMAVAAAVVAVLGSVALLRKHD